jgi:hypothetical protein
MNKVFLALALTWASVAYAADPAKPHPHKGVSERFKSPSPSPLSTVEKASLLQGDAIRRQVKKDSGGRGVSIMDVRAPTERVWEVILNYGAYPEWIGNLERTQTYRNAGNHRFVTFELEVFGMDVIYYIDHTIDRDQGRLTWQLDYTRESDIDDSTGYWLVYPAPGHPGFTRVEYSVDLRLKGWVPGIVENMLADKGLDMATSWVKKQAETSG